ncbi:MAG: SDR family NAD(P)-dependent oxidoreductase [Bacteriovoracaceae bacterium]|nr:SDR family NAD(P)-dependent oxidoreductase [Bacteriovoracaceae bacterium]
MLRVKSVFITGASSGLGLELAKLYKSKGWRVGACARRADVLNMLKEKYGFETYAVDVVDRDQMSQAIEDFSKEGLDLVIANAGKSYEKKTRLPNFSVGRELIDINLLGVMNTFEPAVNKMLEQNHGQLAAISSIAALNGLPGVSAYSASKAAVAKLCESLGLDLARENISVTCIFPGFIDTPLTQKNPHPMPSMISVEEAANKVYEGISKKKRKVFFPFKFTMMVRILALLPRSIYAKIMSMKKFNYSLEE